MLGPGIVLQPATVLCDEDTPGDVILQLAALLTLLLCLESHPSLLHDSVALPSAIFLEGEIARGDISLRAAALLFLALVTTVS